MTVNGASEFDPAAETERLVQRLQQAVLHRLKKRTAVVGISGGVDSAVALHLCVRALSPQRVTALILAEKESSPESERLARELARGVGVVPVKEDITPALEGFGCYRRRDQAVRQVFPEFNSDAGYKVKITLPADLFDNGALNVFSVTIVTPEGETKTKPLPSRQFRQIVAASNFKQRTRMALLYHYAELADGAVIGTANKNEVDQGFFVKFGDSGVDVRLLGHLYKSQVYCLAAFLNVPEAIRRRAPTSDTYSAFCTQQEFFFRLPFSLLDQLMTLAEAGVAPEAAAPALGLTPQQVQHAMADIRSKHRATEYLRTPPLSLDAALEHAQP